MVWPPPVTVSPTQEKVEVGQLVGGAGYLLEPELVIAGPRSSGVHRGVEAQPGVGVVLGGHRNRAPPHSGTMRHAPLALRLVDTV